MPAQALSDTHRLPPRPEAVKHLPALYVVENDKVVGTPEKKIKKGGLVEKGCLRGLALVG